MDKKPYVVSPHGMLHPWALRVSRWKKHLASRLYENNHLQRATCLHALNDTEAEAIRAYGLRKPICIVPSGVEIPTCPPRVKAPWFEILPPDARVLLYLGRLHPIKGLPALLRGWSHVRGMAKDANWHLAIAGWGQGGHETELLKLSTTLGLGKTVHFLGPQFGEAKGSCFHAASAFVLPSLSEALPMTVLEAWAYGMPVLMTRQCNLPSGFEVGAALRIEPDAESIAVELRVLFQMSDVDRRAIGSAASHS
jgi:glycosyltransferase involved in cell wall biosynthesis